MGERLADKSTAVLDVFVTGFMTEIVVNVFEVIEVKYHHGKLADLSVSDIDFNVFLEFRVGVDVPDAGKRILVSYGHDHAELAAALDPGFDDYECMNDACCQKTADRVERHKRELCLEDNEYRHDGTGYADRIMMALFRTIKSLGLDKRIKCYAREQDDLDIENDISG